MAKNAITGTASRACRSLTAASAFLVVLTPAPSSLGQKPALLYGKERRFAGPSYARQSYTGASAFPHCPDSSNQPLESLQPFQQWQRTPLPARLPALVGA
ncbi:hypothetical protein [Planococcus sp. 4-30]|uniref:hypothetical protein n=1 Tax=Planococcus sp. 4-30 TaxID=2874583 RepID=UPI001CC0C411|nr:hypothetical protein [Planococcus sp. 4-30]